MTHNVNRYTAPNPQFEDTMSIAHGLPYLEILKGSGTQELTFLPISRKWGMNCKLVICQSKTFKQFWILISQYNYKTLRAPWEIIQKKKDEPKSKLNGIKES